MTQSWLFPETNMVSVISGESSGKSFTFPTEGIDVFCIIPNPTSFGLKCGNSCFITKRASSRDTSSDIVELWNRRLQKLLPSRQAMWKNKPLLCRSLLNFLWLAVKVFLNDTLVQMRGDKNRTKKWSTTLQALPWKSFWVTVFLTEEGGMGTWVRIGVLMPKSHELRLFVPQHFFWLIQTQQCEKLRHWQIQLDYDLKAPSYMSYI